MRQYLVDTFGMQTKTVSAIIRHKVRAEAVGAGRLPHTLHADHPACSQ